MKRSSFRRRAWLMLAIGGVLMQVIPFGCGQSILRLVTPILLDDTFNVLDGVVRLVAPLVLP
ncbi:MAG: hypothetical protein IT450_00995 [Phycisphaerales bacterium]|nr:hypothetical protein [Phycisphaerales bacterium]